MLKNLQAYVTYKIAVKNTGDVNVKINEIVDYYDEIEFENPVGTTVQLVKDDTYIGDMFGEKTKAIETSGTGDGLKITNTGMKNRTRTGSKVLKTSTQSKLGESANNGYSYKEVYITNINQILETDKSAQPNLKSVMYIYLTFKVKNEVSGKCNGKIRLDYSNNENGEGDPYTNENPLLSIGKRNIAEINDYETKYPSGSKIPDYLDGSNKVDKTTEGTTPGLVDKDSNPGSLNNLDINDKDGSLKIEKTSKIIDGKPGITVNDRQEDDTNQSPNIIFRINGGGDGDDTRKLKGYVFEDTRENESEATGGAAIGDGNFASGDTKINGVTLELVELVPTVDPTYQLSTGNYTKERIWGSYQYNDLGALLPADSRYTVDNSRYASGDGKSKIIINGTGIFKINDGEDLQKDKDGAYVFKSFPTGDFFVRFKYGDTDETTLMTNEAAEKIAKEIGQINEFNGNILSVNTLLGTDDDHDGRNKKSYNGQDYKSTVYQPGIAQNGSYNGINVFTRYGDNEGEVGQNYNVSDLKIEAPNLEAPLEKYDNAKKYYKATESYDVTNKDSMYYYNIAESDKSATVSDAKDVWYYRDRANKYGRGSDESILLNRRAETLASYYKLASFAPVADEIKDQTVQGEEDGKYYTYDNGYKKYDRTKPYFVKQQRDMIDELEKNTFMVAQTGIINTEFEYNRKTTVYGTDSLVNTVENLCLGLVERPKAQLKLNKEVINYNLTLQNGQEVFNAQKSVNNLAYSGHVQHYVKKENGLIPYYISYEDEDHYEVNPRVGRPGGPNNEIIQNYVDNEMLVNATMNVIYKLIVENAGEVDYIDKKFYYTGIEDNKDGNISTTEAIKVVDYVPNQLRFEQIAQEGEEWSTTNVETLIGSTTGEDGNIEKEAKNIINRLYLPELKTYKTIIETNSGLNGRLKPGDKSETNLALSSEVKSGMKEDSLTYNNMAEIVALANSNGRRCAFSIPGNEEMADQSVGNDAAEYTKSSISRLEVKEIDADSAQKIVIMPPTGKFKSILGVYKK